MIKDRLFTNVRTWHAVKHTLKNNGIKWKVAKKQVFLEHDPWTGRTIKNEGIHIYFFEDNTPEAREVGYWTPMMDTLLIHHTPRIWSLHLNCIDYDYNEEDEKE